MPSAATGTGLPLARQVGVDELHDLPLISGIPVGDQAPCRGIAGVLGLAKALDSPGRPDTGYPGTAGGQCPGLVQAPEGDTAPSA
jgi:hypothetical protein